MPEDPTLHAIDRFFDLFDNGIEKADRILNRSKYSEEQLEEVGKRGRKGKVIDVEPSEPKTKRKAPAGSATANTAIMVKPNFYIVEAQKDGETIYVVTDGRKARTECSTRVFAEKILRSLEAA